MRLEQFFQVTAPSDVVWQAFHDIALLVDCLPGASINSAAAATEEGAIALLFKVKLGPIAAGFAGQARLKLDDALRSGAIAGAAIDARSNSRVKGEANFTITDAPKGGTNVQVTVDYTITGTLAQFSREGIVRALAEQLTKQFADNLQARLPQPAAKSDAGEGAGTAADGAAVAAPMSPPMHKDTSSIDLWMLIRAWFSGLFSRRRN